MKRAISMFALSAMLTGFIAGCSVPVTDNIMTVSTASAYGYLTERLGEKAEGIVLGTQNDAASYGVDLSELRDEGYIIRKNGDDTLIFGKTEDGLDRGVRAYVKDFSDSDAVDYTYGEGYRVKKIEIGGRDISEYDIYLFGGADECHTTAANELQKYIELACGVHLDIVREKTEHMIVYEQVTEADSRYAVLGDEGFNISVKEDGNLYITGGKWRGCLYGTYEFLEAYIGWRFVVNFELKKTVDDSDYYLYESELVEIPIGLEDEQTPSFPYRQGRYFGTGGELYAAKQKENNTLREDAPYNGYGYLRAACHGLLSGPIKYGYFDDIADDAVIAGTYQPCFTDELIIEATIDYYTKNIESRIAAGQEVGREITHIDVSQNDNMNFCQCDNCMDKIILDGSNTGPMIYFANTIAEHFSADYPELYIDVLVYAGTTKPPKVTEVHPNINASYCFYIDSGKVYCSNHCLSGEDCIAVKGTFNSNISNEKYAEELEEWCEIATRVTVWTYPGSWYYNQIPVATLATMWQDYNYLYECGVYGIYPCMQDVSDWDSQDYFISLMFNELSWNADMSEEEFWAIVEEYMTIFYGEGAVYILEYLDWLESAEVDECFTMQGFSYPQRRQNLTKVMNDFDYCIELFDKALALAPSAKAEEGIEYFSRPMYFAGLCASYEDKYVNGTDAERADYAARYDRLRELAVGKNFYIHFTLITEDMLDVTKHPGTLHNDAFYTETEWWLK